MKFVYKRDKKFGARTTVYYDIAVISLKNRQSVLAHWEAYPNTTRGKEELTR